MLHSFTDHNGDDVGDLVVLSLNIESMWNVDCTYEVHFGTPTGDGGTAFAPDIDYRAASRDDADCAVRQNPERKLRLT